MKIKDGSINDKGRTLELFSGTKSFSKVMEKNGYGILTIDNDESLKPDLCFDILTIDSNKIKDLNFDFIWASPPCTAFSVASIGRNWTGGHRAYIPKSDNARLGLKLLDKTIEIISVAKPKYWCIENPRGVMRKVIDKIFDKYNMCGYKRMSVCYCQYGDTRMKPTDIWTNIIMWRGKMCYNGCNDHEAAPRGSKTGTQGLKGAKERGVIPPKLFKEMLNNLSMGQEER